MAAGSSGDGGVAYLSGDMEVKSGRSTTRSDATLPFSFWMNVSCSSARFAVALLAPSRLVSRLAS